MEIQQSAYQSVQSFSYYEQPVQETKVPALVGLQNQATAHYQYTNNSDLFPNPHEQKSIEAQKLNILKNVEEFQLAPFQRMMNEDHQNEYRDYHHQHHQSNNQNHNYNNHIAPQRAQSAFDMNQPIHRRVQSQAVNNSQSPNRSIANDGYPPYSKKSTINPEVKFLQKRVDDAISAFDKYKNSHFKRLDTVKQSIKKHAKFVEESQQVQQEIQLLKKVRKMTRQSYQNRIKTGGSLMDFSIFKAPNPNDFLHLDKPQKSYNFGHEESNYTTNDKRHVNLDDNDKFKQYFKHIPKYPLKSNSIKSSSRVTHRMQAETAPQTIVRESVQQVKEKKSLSRTNDLISKSIDQKQLLKINIATVKADQEILRKDQLKSMIYSLPVILAKNPHDRESIDYKFYQATNHIYHHEYDEAFEIFEQMLFGQSVSTQFQREMCDFNKAFCCFKLGQFEKAILIWERVTFFSLQILSKFNISIVHILNENYQEALETFNFAMQQQIHGFMKIDWIHLDDYNKKAVQIFNLLEKQLKPKTILGDESDTEPNLNVVKIQKKLTSIRSYFQDIKKLIPAKDSQLNTIRTQANNRTASVTNIAPSKSVSSLAPSINFKKQKSISISSDYDAFSSYQSPKKSQLAKDLDAIQKNEILIPDKKEYFPIPFEKTKRQTTSNSSRQLERQLERQQKMKQDRQQKLLQKLINPSMDELGVYQNQSENQLDGHLNSVSFMSQQNIEQLVYKQYQNSRIEETITHSNNTQTRSIYSRHKLTRKQSQLFQRKQTKKDLEVRECLNMDLIDEQIKELDQVQYPTEVQQSESTMQIEYDNQGFAIRRPHFIDKEHEIDIEKILGLNKKVELNEKEKDIQEKRKQIEKDYMIDKVMNNLEADQNSDDGDDDSLTKRNNNFLMDNFLKIYDRTPNHKNDESAEMPKTLPKLNIKKGLTSNPKSKHNQSQQSRKSGNNDSRASQRRRNSQKNVKVRGENHTDSEDERRDVVYKKRLRLTEVDQVVNFIKDRETLSINDYKLIDPFLKKLSFFAKYPVEIRRQLIMECELNITKCGDILFYQGDTSPQFYVLLRGSVKAILIKKDYGNIPIIINTYYDGKEFGEVNFYEESENLNSEMVVQLNKQKYTCEAMEDSYVICLEKDKTNKIINQNLQANFEKRIDFLKQIEIFKGMEMHVLLPLANNLITETYRLGEYILREGQQPKGLYLIFKGQCKVGSEKLNMRSKTPFSFGNKLKKQIRNFKFKGNFHDLEEKLSSDQKNQTSDRIETRESNNEPLNIAKIGNDKIMRSDKRVFQNDRIYYDEAGKRIKDHIIYKDYDYFGGRVLLIGDTQNHRIMNFDSDYDGEQSQTSFMKQSKLAITEDQSHLSVIADSSEVELLIMDRTQLSFFQEKVQKEIYHRIEKAFQPDQPYESAVVEKIKDKFREWEKYKLETVNSILKFVDSFDLLKFSYKIGYTKEEQENCRQKCIYASHFYTLIKPLIPLHINSKTYWKFSWIIYYEPSHLSSPLDIIPLYSLTSFSTSNRDPGVQGISSVLSDTQFLWIDHSRNPLSYSVIEAVWIKDH
ncbi:camp-dependent protein kinase regulatory subunit [Stylonychia lemnae]|uniref:Camp-dependent protein kinase regulatory subunit n=1 Tax=Stylonychia lemnae TaxID=5949 RepID=A0A078ASN2_STYLE|nr:camp-dependent protein kinase regulatory subunit [Stylonychia lemnae]|eukprot:CDW85001.1 camp-dependent protein kinase regulatory subunit [Stylonychia lemnae]